MVSPDIAGPDNLGDFTAGFDHAGHPLRQSTGRDSLDRRLEPDRLRALLRLRGPASRAVSGPSFLHAYEPKLLHKSEAACRQMLQMRITRESIRSVYGCDRTEPLRSRHR